MTSRTRRQTRIQSCDGKDEAEQRARLPAYASPAMRLYRHALESILAMLDLADLSRMLAVSREWSAAVRSMALVHGSIQRTTTARFSLLPPIPNIVGSPLLRHLTAIQIGHTHASETRLDNDSLALLAQHATNLTSLWCKLTLTSDEPLVLPSKLKTLHLQLDGGYSDSEINGVLTALAALPSLSRLCIVLSQSSDVDLSLLAACPSLIDLTIGTLNGSAPKFSVAQVKQIRSSLGHLHRFSIVWMDSNMLTRLLQPPVTVSWRDIGQVYADERTGELLLRLPALTKLELSYFQDTAHVDFLLQLPQLTALDLVCYRWGRGGWFVPADALLASLQLCSELTELSLHCGFNSAQWSALFDKLRIKKLTVCGGAIETLRCFAEGPITQSLEELDIRDLALPPSEVAHLYALRRLRALRLDCCFSSRLDDDTVDSLSPPTRLLPSLTELFHRWKTPELQRVSVDRKGASFE